MKRLKMTLGLAALLILLSGCGDKGGVFVQSVEQLSHMGGIAPGDRFSCMVVSEKVTEIQKDSEKKVQELFVREGDDVKKGDPLFCYDTDELQLSVDKLTLERDQLIANIENFTRQIEQLEQDSAWMGGREKLEYTIQIQSTQIDLKEAEINLKGKENSLKSAQELLKNATVKAPVAARVQSINEGSQADSYGQESTSSAYIILQQAGAYRIKGVLGELQRGGISMGDRVKMVARNDETKAWYGTVSLVDYENPVKNNNNYYGPPQDEMTTSSKYPFYVELDTTEGLMMGQHLYLTLDTGEETQGLPLDASFICFNDDGSAYVWADRKGKLEKRAVTLGEFNEMRNTYAIVDGLRLDDYIAFPDSSVCKPGAATTKVRQEAQEGEGDAMGGDMIDPGFAEDLGGISEEFADQGILADPELQEQLGQIAEDNPDLLENEDLAAAAQEAFGEG